MTIKSVGEISSTRNRVADTLRRFVRSLSVRSGELGTSALSFAMLVFLIQEAQAAGLLSDTGLPVTPREGSDLDAVRRVFGDSGSESVAGIDYATIVEALAKINQLSSQESAAVEGEEGGVEAGGQGTDLAANALGSDVEANLLASYLQDAVQYAQLSTEAAAAEGVGTVATAEAATAAAAVGGLGTALPLILAGFGLIASSQTSSGSVVKVPNTPSSVASPGAAFDDYIVGADVWQDLDGDGVMDDNEPQTTTDAFGKYTLNLVAGSSAFIIVRGGHMGSADGPAFTGTLKAPAGSSVVSPLTTLVASLMADGKTLAEAKAAMMQILGITDPDFDLLAFDPFDPDNADNDLTSLIQIKGQQIGALLSLAGDSSDALAAQIAKGLSSGSLSFDDLSDSAKLQDLFDDAGASTDGIDFDAVADAVASQSKSLAVLATTIQAAGGVAGLNLAGYQSKGIEIIDVDGAYVNSNLSIDSADVAAMSSAGLTFATADTITLDLSTSDDISVSGSYLSGSLNSALGGVSQGLSLSALGALGVDAIDIDGRSNATLHIGTADAKAMHTAGLHFADGDTISLDVGGFDDVNAFNGSGSYLVGSLNSAVTVASQGLSLSALGALGVDVIDIGGSKTGAGNGRLHIDSADALAVSNAGLSFADGDTITLDLSTTDDISVTGSYLSGSLDSAVSGMSHGLSLSGLSALGVDVIDINGSSVDGTLSISSADASAMSGADLVFASGDTITLDVSTTDDISVTGSYLSGSLDSAVSGMSHGLGLSGLGALGVDVIDVNGNALNVALHISSADSLAMNSAGLRFASGDTISLDLSADDLDGTGVDGTGSGSYLAGTLDASLGNAGLSLSDLGDLGVSVIDIGGSDESATLHISSSDVAAMANAGLSFAVADDIVLDGADFSGVNLRSVDSSTSAEKLVSAVGDSLGLHAMGVDQVEVDQGVMVTLHEDAGMVFGADQSLKDLLIALGESGITADDMANSLDAVSAVNVGAEANFAIDDAMVKALMDAGLLSANTSSTIEVDTDSEHMSTSLSQLADIGADKVATSQDKVYVDLGDVSDADALATLLQNLADGSSTLFVQQTDGAAVQEVGLVLTADQATLATAIEADAAIMAQLTHVGITELLIATGDAQTQGDVTLLGQEYTKVFVG
ncbi:MAG: hypothetical protein QE283_02495 [Rhodoferax sp.]|nr:hypothetical protein [Rhodoferax sp.]